MECDLELAFTIYRHHPVGNFMRKNSMTELGFSKVGKVQNLPKFTNKTEKNKQIVSPQRVVHNLQNVQNGMTRTI